MHPWCNVLPWRSVLITVSDLSILRGRLEAVGAFRRRPVATWTKFVLLMAGAAALWLVPLLTGLPWLSWALLPVTALFVTGGVMIGHEGGHKSLSDSTFGNNLMLYLTFPIMGGLSALYWKDKHNVKHHTQPNIDGVDEDLDLWPMAGSRRQYEESGPCRKFFQRHLQAYLFWPLSSLLTLSMHYSSISFIVRKARKSGWSPSLVADAASLALHFFVWLVAPALFFGVSFWVALGAYLAFWAIIGVYLTAIFAPAHMGLPIYKSHDDIWRLQLEVTRNLDMPGWLRFFFIGLDYQVEHHMFMRLPHQSMKVAAPIVEQWAQERGLPYQRIGFVNALIDVTRFVRTAWRHDTPCATTRTSAESPAALPPMQAPLAPTA